MNASTTKLTTEQQKFFGAVRLRSMSSEYGQPFIADQLFAIIPVSSPGIGPKPQIDRRNHVYIDFDLAMAAGVAATTRELLHVAWHPLLDHHNRGSAIVGDNLDRWTVATDGEVQIKVVGNGTKKDLSRAPEGILTPKDFDVQEGLLAEQAFHLLPDPNKPEEPEAPEEEEPEDEPDDSGSPDSPDEDAEEEAPDEDEPDEDGDSDGEGDADSDDDPEDDGDSDESDESEDGEDEGEGESDKTEPGEDGEPEQGDASDGEETDREGDGDPDKGTTDTGNGKPSNVPGPGPHTRPSPYGDVHQCGSGAGGPVQQSYEIEQGASGLSETQMMVVRQAVIDRILSGSMSRGDAAGGALLNWARDARPVRRIPWEQVMTSKFRRVVDFIMGQGSVSWTVRSPLSSAIPKAVIPGDVAPQVNVMGAVDTSGSNTRNMGLALEQFSQIMKRLNIRGRSLRIFPVDAKIGNVQMVHRIEDLDMSGGGGTDMRVAFQYVGELNQRDQPDVFVLFTDGETDWPEENPNPKIKWMVCLTPNPYNTMKPDEMLAELPDWIDGMVVDVLPS